MEDTKKGRKRSRGLKCVYALYTDIIAGEPNYVVGKYRLSLKLPRSLPIDLHCNMSIIPAM